jgi:hypothetical protein
VKGKPNHALATPAQNLKATGVAKHSLKKKSKAGNKKRLLSQPWKIIKKIGHEKPLTLQVIGICRNQIQTLT